jgi:hypothetical protein
MTHAWNRNGTCIMNSLSSLNERMAIVWSQGVTSKKSLCRTGDWVTTQRSYHKHNKLRLDRKRILDEIGFAWEADAAHNMLWQNQLEKLVEFKRENGHCMVPCNYEQDKSLGVLTSIGAFIRTRNFDQTEREFWTKSGSFGQLNINESMGPQTPTTRSGTSSMKGWSSFNERVDIVGCITCTNKTSL